MDPIISSFLATWRSNNGFADTDASELSAAQKESFVRQLQAEVAKLSVRPFDPTGANTWRVDANPLLYGNKVYGAGGFQVAELISHASDGRIYYISDTSAGRLLNESGLQVEIAKVIGGAEQTRWAGQIVNGVFDDATGERTSKFSISNLVALNDFVSERMVMTARGDVRILAPFAEIGRVLGDTELPAALLRNADITRLNGLPKLIFQAVYDVALAKGGEAAANQALLEAIKYTSAELAVKLQIAFVTITDPATGLSKTVPVAVESGDFFKNTPLPELKIPAGTLADPTVQVQVLNPTPAQVAELERGALALGEAIHSKLAVFEGTGKWLGRAGIAATGASAYFTGIEIGKAIEAGDSVRAGTIAAEWTAQTAGGWATGIAAASLVGTKLLPFALAGGPITQIGLAIVVGGVGLGAGFGGSKFVETAIAGAREVVNTIVDGNWSITEFANGMRLRQFVQIPNAPPVVLVGAADFQLDVPNGTGGYDRLGLDTGTGKTVFSQWSGVPDQSTQLFRVVSQVNGAGGVDVNIFTNDVLTSSSQLTQDIEPSGADTLANLTGPASTFIDSLSLIRAIQSGQPLPIAASGLRLASGIDGLINTPGQANLVLSGASAAASGILSIISLQRSLQSGDAFGALSAGGQALNFAADAYLKLAAEGLLDGASNVAAAQVRDFLTGSTSVIDTLDGSVTLVGTDPTGGFLPYLNLALAIRDENPVSIASAVLAFIPGGQPIALALQAFQLIDGLFGGNNPGQLSDTWGNANLQFAGNALTPGVTYNAYGSDSAGPMLGSLLGQMHNVLANAQASNPAHPLGLIPMRMPNLSVTRNPYTHLAQWRISDINPLTGAARHPGAYYDDSGRSYGSIDNPEALQSLSERFIRSSLAREAIAPLWEVQTAFLKNALGDPNAGYSEEETAARLGKQGVDPNTLPTLSRLGFRPVLLDLNSDGLFSTFNLVPTGQTGTATNPAHAFDAQDDGYLRSTGWVKSTEGILVLDRNLNGTIDSGREVFSNGKVNDASKGVASLAWVDANLDGVIDSNDPVFNELQVWVDVNGNSQSETGELIRLNALGITAINYAGKTFTRGVADAGVGNAGTVTLTTGLLASPDLAAERDGTQQSLTADGLLIQSSNGTLSLIVNNVQDLSGTANGQDGLTGIEDAQLIVGAGDLTQNDVVGGYIGALGTLTLTGVSNALHGTVVLTNGVITYTPEANWFTEKQSYNANRTEVKDANGNTIFTHVAGREAGFDYSVTAPNGATDTFHANVALKNVNDKPVITIKPQGRDVYGTLVSLVPYDYFYNENGAYPTFTVVQQTQYVPFTQPAIPAGAYVPAGSDEGYTFYGPYAGLPGAQHNTVQYIEPYNNNRGQVLVTDPDGPNQTFSFSASYGSFGQGVVRSYGSYAEYGYINWAYPGVPGADFAAYSGYGGDGFYAYATDEAGAQAYAGIGVLHAGGYGGCAGSGGCNGPFYYGPFWPQPPLVVDLAGNGFSFKQAADADPVYFDTFGDGYQHRTSWIKPGEGFIAYDMNGDSKITSAGELQFTGYARGAATDLEGLRAFDTNGDGLLSALDAGWSKFGIWQDANSDGVSDAGEFQSMTALGVASLALASDQVLEIVDGQAIYGKTTLTFADGQTRAVADRPYLVGRGARQPGRSAHRYQHDADRGAQCVRRCGRGGRLRCGQQPDPRQTGFEHQHCR